MNTYNFINQPTGTNFSGQYGVNRGGYPRYGQQTQAPLMVSRNNVNKNYSNNAVSDEVWRKIGKMEVLKHSLIQGHFNDLIKRNMAETKQILVSEGL